MNSGAMMAASYDSRATSQPKMEPVPVVSTSRQTKANQPTALPSRVVRDARRSIMANR